METLLACGIPELEFDVGGVEGKGVEFEIDADGAEVLGFEGVGEVAVEQGGFADALGAAED